MHSGLESNFVWPSSLPPGRSHLRAREIVPGNSARAIFAKGGQHLQELTRTAQVVEKANKRKTKFNFIKRPLASVTASGGNEILIRKRAGTVELNECC